jgi:GT2 family glycosyltransferase
VSVSVVIVSYHGDDEVLRCVGSVRATAPEAQIVVVENGTPGAALAAAAAARDELELIVPGRNLGFGGGCNLGARRADGEVLVFLNPDSVVAPGAVAALAHALEDDGVGIATARLRLLDEPELLNSGGNVLHVSGLAWVGGYRRPVASAAEPREVPFPTGAAMAMRADLFRALGGFREELFMYHEDVDLGWRVWLSGLRVVMTPAADVHHEYAFERNPGKRYLLERNRLSFVLSAFSGRLLLLLVPVLLAAEAAMAVLAWREGWLRAKVAGWAWCARNAGTLARRRRETQSLRRVPDRDVAHLLTAVLDPAVVPVPAVLRLANPLVAAYWSVARRVL